MTLTLAGRIQTRLLLLLTIGLIWNLVLALPPGTQELSGRLEILALMGLLGMGWDLAYHAAQQVRRDRDWPALFGLVAAVPEAFVLWSVAGASPLTAAARGTPGSFTFMFGTTWVLMYLCAQGPLRVVIVRWRLNGGRVLRRRRPLHRRNAAACRGRDLARAHAREPLFISRSDL